MRIWLVGTGMVGRWLLRVFADRAAELQGRYAFSPKLVGVSNAQHGFVHNADGIDPGEVLRGLEQDQGLAAVGAVERVDSALAGMRASEADLLIEVSRGPRLDGEPGATHMREAIRRRIPVATSNKWPVALHGVELKRLASEAGVGFRAESTVMSGTPLLSLLLEGLAGARPLELRGVLNATANSIATRVGEGIPYEQALREAQRAGLAEADPREDVEGWDAVAKLMILAALLFDRQLTSDEVERRGIDQIRTVEPRGPRGSRRVVKPVESLLAVEAGALVARTGPEELDPDDPLAAVTGVGNALICRCDPLGEVMLTGPGAGPALAGQGVLSDAIALAGSRR